jgi:hypothetical protein
MKLIQPVDSSISSEASGYHPVSRETNYHSESLSSRWIEQMRGLLELHSKTYLRLSPEDGRSRLTSLGQYLFQHLLPTELQSDFRRLIPAIALSPSSSSPIKMPRYLGNSCTTVNGF